MKDKPTSTYKDYSEMKLLNFKPSRSQYRLLKWLQASTCKESNEKDLTSFAVFPGDAGLVMTMDGFTCHLVNFYGYNPFLKPGAYEAKIINSNFCSFSYAPELPRYVFYLGNILDINYIVPKKQKELPEKFMPGAFLSGAFIARAVGKMNSVRLLFSGDMCYVIPSEYGTYYPRYADMLAIIMQIYDKVLPRQNGAIWSVEHHVVENALRKIGIWKTLEALKKFKDEDTKKVKV